MGFAEAVRAGFGNYANFAGRAARPAYWWWTLFGVLVGLATWVLDGLLGSSLVRTTVYGAEVSVGAVTVLVGLALLLPSIAVLVRRLHDANWPGSSLLLLCFIPGWVVLLYVLVRPGTPGDNRYGPPPAA